MDRVKYQVCKVIKLGAMLCTNLKVIHMCGGIGKVFLIRDFPDHATFREMGAKLACADKLGVFLSLTLCNKANFDPLQ